MPISHYSCEAAKSISAITSFNLMQFLMGLNEAYDHRSQPNSGYGPSRVLTRLIL